MFLDNTPNQPTKCRTKNWVEINDHSDAYIFISGTVAVAALAAGRRNRRI